jgi:hypothetical protein
VCLAEEQPARQFIVLLIEGAAGDENANHDDCASPATKNVSAGTSILAASGRAAP